MNTKFHHPRFLVTDLVPEPCMSDLKALGFEVDHLEDLSNEELAGIISNYTGIVVRTSLIFNKAMIDKATQLKYILRPGSGLDNIDMDYASEKGILVLNSPEANSHAVAEHAMGLLLGLLNHIPRSFEQIKNRMYERHTHTGVLLMGKTVGIIGYGNTGAAMAAKLIGFGVDILVYDKYKKGFSDIEDKIKETDMAEIFENADVISLHIPLDSNTQELINDDFINYFKKPFYLINTSRGKIADLDAVTRALQSGKLLGAGLDVIPNENFSKYTEEDFAKLQALWSAGNVIITPHIAGWTKESREAIFYVVLEKFKAYMGDKKN